MDSGSILSPGGPLLNDFADFNLPGEEATDKLRGLKCELKTYDVRYNATGERLVLEVDTRREVKENKPSFLDSAFIVKRFYGRDTTLDFTELEIQSPYVKTALQTVIVRYPGINFHSKRIALRDTPKCVFHYRNELEAYRVQPDNPDALRHIQYLMLYMYRTLESQLSCWYNLMESPLILPGLYFEDLWMAFRPGDCLYTHLNGGDRVFRLLHMTRCVCPDPHCEKSKWLLKVDHITFDGTAFGYTPREFYIQPYQGYSPLMRLTIFPLQYHVNCVGMTDKLLMRGRKFASLQGIHYRFYSGLADELLPSQPAAQFIQEHSSQSKLIRSRIMIDTKMLGLIRPSNKIVLTSLLDPNATEHRIQPKFSDENYLTCDRTVPGFCFATKEWYMYDVELIAEVNFNTKAFESLLLPNDQKDMVHSLVRVHTSDGQGFDDVIKGKGRGLILLFHGDPGVGKTLTAESVADYTKRPLYTLGSGELGIDSISAEANLAKALRLAASWKAVVLIDEADVFMEQRRSNDLKRNALVSNFLRLLEYFQGILILTTNRIDAIDTAFKSRIHLAIKFQPLSQSFRRDLWCAFIIRASSNIWPDWMDNDCLDWLSIPELNGRQIKNTICIAKGLALSHGCAITKEHIDKCLRQMESFDSELEQNVWDNGDRAMQEPRSKRQRNGYDGNADY